MVDIKFRCMKGKHDVVIKNPGETKCSNGQPAYVAQCPQHSTRMFRFKALAPGETRKSRGSKKSKKSRKSRK